MPPGIQPKFIDKPKIKQSGKNVIFEVVAEADPAPEILWTKAGNEIKNSSRYKTNCRTLGKQHTLTLEINQVTADDGGEYLVTAKNKLGDSTATINLNIGSAKSPPTKAPKFLEKPVIRMDKSKGEVILSCKLEAKPAATLSWYLNDQEINEISGKRVWEVSEQPDDIYIIEIHIISPKPEDGGMYKIHAKNSAGESNANINLNLQANQKQAGKGPVFEKPKIYQNNQGRDVVLECRCSADPAPTFTWYQNTKELKARPGRYQIEESKDGAVFLNTLKIISFMNADAGTYKLTAKNSSGDATAVMEVKMPKIVGMPNIRFEDNNQRAFLEVRVDSGNPPEAKWSHSGKSINVEGRYSSECTMEGRNYVMSLTINDLTEKDSGLYECEIFNGVGKVQQSITVKVPPKDPKVKLPQIVGYLNSQTAELGRTFIMTVDYSVGSVTPQAKVLKNGTDLSLDKRCTVRVDSTKHSVIITIKNVQIDDKSTYTLQLLANGNICDKGNFDLSVIQVNDEANEEVDEVGELHVPSNKGSRRSSTVKKEEEYLNRRASQEKPGLLDPKALEQSLQARRDSMTNRRTSLADAIPGFAGLKHRETPKVEKEYFVEELQDVKIKEGSLKALLKCTFCKSTSKFRWYKNKLEIFQGPKYNFLQEGNEFALEIKKIAMEDVGKYTCKCNDISTTCTIQVEEKKHTYHFNQKLPKTAEVVRGKDLTVECSVSDPRATVSWYHKGEKVEYVAGKIEIKRRENRCILRIVRARPEQEGEYCCIVEGDETYMDIAVEDPDWSFTRELKPQQALENDELVTFECEVSDRDAEVTWYKNGELITANDKYEILAEKKVKRILKVKKVTMNDDAEYTCKVAKKTTTARCTVKPDVEFRQNLIDTKGIETKHKELECRAFNPKKYPVYWFKDGLPIQLNDRISATEVEGSLYLIFQYLEMDDTGYYSCKIGNHETKGLLEVQECEKPPSVDLTNFKNQATLKKGANFMTAVPFKGFPVPQVVLMCNGEPVNEGIKLKPVVKGNIVELQLEDAARADSGKYELKLKNEFGEASVPLELTVLDRPGKPRGPLILTSLAAKKCVLEWDPPEDDGGSPIKHYVVEKMDVSDGNWKLVKNAKTPQCEVDLEEGHKYKFRVRAVNNEGESDNLEVEKEVLARDVCDPPDAPTGLEIEDYDRDHAKLKWLPPRRDNGAPVLKYILEAKAKSKNKWEMVKEVSDPAAKVDLKEGEEYQFRVIAVNKAGKSEPSEISKPLIAKPRFLKPFIIKTGLKPIKVKVGEVVQLKLDFRGEPDPVAVWSKESTPLESTPEIELTFEPRSASLKILSAQRKDTALYTLRVSNEVGEDQASIEVVALGKPSRPVPPMEITEVTKNSAQLSWNKPEDDGGTPITHYKVEKMNLNKGRWEPVAEVTKGLTATVNKLEEGQPYKFRIIAVSSQGESEPLECDTEIIAKNPFERPGPPEKPEIADYDRTHIDIKWEPPEDDGGAPIKGYHVERREPRSQRWMRLTRVPQRELTYSDSGVREGKEYEYRVIAVNEGGLSDPSPPTDLQVAKASREPPKLKLTELPLGIKQEIRLRAGEPLHMPIPITGAPTPTITWSKDNKPLPTRCQLQNSEEHTCLDVPKSVRDDSGLYKIHLANEYGQDEAVVKVVVMDKPSPPTDVEAIDIYAESCKITWKPPVDDGGTPITDYLIERCDETGIWERVSGLVTDNSINVKNLIKGKSYRFRVFAVNMIGNSEPGETKTAILAKNPYDPPGAPEKLNIDEYDKRSVKLSWKPPAEDGGNPIKGYLIEKRLPRGEWRKATGSLVPGTEATVTGIEEGQTYEFRVSAVNDAGPGKPSKATEPHLVRDPVYPPGPPEGLTVEKANKNGVKLSWNKPRRDGNAPVTGYVVEKKGDDDQWIPVQNTTNPCAFVPMKEGETGQFRVRAVNAEGPGEPTKPTAVITAVDPPEPPRICTPEEGVGGPGSGVGGLKDITLKAGQELLLAAAWFGSPKPNPTWTLNEKVVKQDGKLIQISDEPPPPPANPGPGGALEQSSGGTAVLRIPKARRSDGGNYELTLVNDLGQVKTSCHVEVLDVPGPPEGPLEATDVNAEEITLKWKPPLDDGGQPVSNYILEKRVKGSDNWQKVSAFLNSPNATVKNLEVGQEYEFRVMAENPMGVSEPLLTTKAIKARHPYDPPSGMKKPIIETTTDDSVTLSWEPPMKGPTTGYIVEKRPKGSREWTKANTGNVTGTEYTVKGLPKGKEMEFRIVPYNLAGVGEPSEPTELVKVQFPTTPPKIGRNVPREVTGRVGEPFKIHIPFTGSPPDKVEVTKNGIPVPLEGGRFKMEITPDEVIITDKEAEKNDGGLYKIDLENEKGHDSVPVNVKIVGPPEPPQGPLEISHIKNNSCSLSWNPPTDNGGSPITNYIVEKQNTKTGDWSVVNSFVRTPNCDITGLDEGNMYRFRVRAANEIGVSEPLDADKAIVAENPSTVPGAPGNLTPTDVDANKVTLEWTKPKSDGGRRIIGYVVEYKPVNSDEWRTAPEGLVKGNSTTVDGLKKGEKYLFRVCAKNEVGLSEPCTANRPVECKPKFTTADSPGTPTIEDVGKNFVDLSWSKPMKDGGARITGYLVEKRKKFATDWEPATPDGKPVMNNNAHIDGLDENAEYEFRVSAVNAAGTGEPSQPTELTKICPKRDKPQPPSNVEAKDIYADCCVLTWNPPESDGGCPIIDYIVEKCDATTEVWERVPTVVTSTSCPIKGLIEGKRYRFRVSAVNTMGPSEPAETNTAITAKNPFDAPDAPEDVKVESFDSHGVTLAWKPPENDGGNPIHGYLIEKRTPNGEWKPATTGLVHGKEAKLTGLEKGQTYEFRVMAVNDAGAGRPSKATLPQVIKDPTYPPSAPDSINVDKVNKNGVKLSWQKPRKDGGSKITGYQVEKKDENGDWVPVKQTTEPCAFIPMKEGETAQFRVRAVNDEGPGEPTRPTAPVTAVDQPEAPRICTPDDCVGGLGSGVGGLKDVKLKAGQDLKLPVAWFGHPKPRFNWSQNDKPIQIDGKRITETNEALPPPANPGPGGLLEMSPGGTVILSVGKVRRADKGQYQLTIVNEQGQATTSCQVEVIDVPSPPGGPLEATDVKADEITLRWKAPEDDGGEPITNYVLQKRRKGSDNWEKVSGFLNSPNATVRNLDEGTEYEFRVMAENAMGQSEPLVTTQPIKAKHPFDPPSGMQKPTVEDTSDDSVTLAWEPPRKGPVTGYIVEKRAKGDKNWSKANAAPISGTGYTVKNLPKGKEFEFRVIPVNAAGQGEPSEPTKLIKVQKPITVPKITVDAPKEINARLGEPFKIRIPFTGGPPEEVELIKDGKPVPLDTNRFKLEVTPNEVIITDTKAEKEDAGQYKVALKNEKGEASHPLTVKVLSPPDAPEGPLEVTDIKGDSCKLTWNPPKNNGGSPITNYIVEKLEPRTGEWLPVSKFVRTPEYEVTGLEPGNNYRFRVRAENELGTSEPLETSRSILAEEPSTVPDAPNNLTVADVDANKITLEWSKPRNDGGKRVNGYVVEYKPLNATEWEQAAIVKDLTATVDGLKKGEKYMFRVSARNEVGVSQPCSTSRAVECKPKHTTADSPGRPNVDDVGKNSIDLSWSRPAKDGGAKVTGYIVEKRKKNSPDWEPAVSGNTPVTGTQAHIDGLDENGEYEFRIKPVNAAGVGEPSEPTPMTKIGPKRDKPNPPEDVEITDLSADSCKLSWKPPAKDGGAPITDYIVEKCDATTGIWEKVPALIVGTTCPIKGLIEGKRYRFRVSAVNPLGQSEPTELLNAVTAKNPFDAPDSPDNLNMDSFDKHSVDLSWTPPKHDGGNPIKGYLVEKRTPKGEWKQATSGLVTNPSAHLIGLEPGETYEFRVSAVNDAGPGRPSRATAPHVMKDPSYPAAAPESLNVDKVNKNGVKLSWQKPRKDGGSKITGYQVEKKDENGDWVPVKQTTEPCAFIPMKEGETAQFRVRAVNDEGPGEPTRPTAPVTAVDQPEAPRICTPDDCVGGLGSGVGGLKDIIIKAGQELKLPVAWFGHPKPTFNWTLNGEPVKIDGARHLELSPGGVVSLVIPKVKRSDHGRYQLTVMNDLGQASTSCQVEVMDAPSAPGGPLEATDISANEITLSWKPPTDDGGQPISNYRLEKRPKGSDSWQTVSGFLKSPNATVRNLEEGTEYEFRVMAENSLGLSEPLMTSSPIKARHPFDPPSGMSQPTVENVTDDSVTLSWEPPRKGPITGYTIEKRGKGDRAWTKVNVHPLSTTEYTVRGLPQSKEFEFRVVPFNAAGAGEPSEPTGYVKIQKPKAAPKISPDAPKQVNVTKGEPFKIRIPYTGSPPDVVEATKDDVPVILDDGRFVVTITPDEVIIVGKKGDKQDEGPYKITLKNDKGQDTLPIKINVLGPPDSPQGPLEVKNIKSNSCTLGWKPPKETGGCPVTHYVVEKQDQSTGEWTPVSKFVRGTEYDVLGLDEGKKHKFRVRAANEFGLSEPLELDHTITTENPSTAPGAPGNVEVADVDANSVTLEWSKPRSDGGSKINGYVIEFRPVNGGSWEKAPTGPIRGNSGTVTGLFPGEKYVFRVLAKNDVGTSEPSSSTRPIECKPKYVPAGSPSEPNVDGVGKNWIDLSWSRPNNDGGARITGYIVEKRKKDSPDWEVATSDGKPITSNYVRLDNLNEGDMYQFRVKAVTAAGPGEPSNPTPIIRIEEKKPTTTPDFVTKIRPTTAPIGGTAGFEVQVDGQPLPSVRWFRDGIELLPGNRIKINPPGPDGKASIEIHDLDEKDSGTITCQVSNPSGKNSCSAPFEVLAIPKILGNIDDKVASEGDLVKLKVPYSGRGSITLKLKCNGHELPESSRVKLMDLDGTASIQLKDVTRNMSGYYTLEIGNESGFSSVPFNLKITSPPGECQGPITVTDTTPFSTRLSWKPPKDDGGSKITHYVIERQEVGKDRWVPVSSGSKEPNCEVQGLQENTHYLFRVAAVNDCGQGDWFKVPNEVIAKYPFDKPGKPGDLTANEVGGDFVNLTWTRPSTDGGGRIRGYIVEKREVGAQNWSRVTPNPILTLSYNVPNLIEDKTYEFRVMAVNDAGESEPTMIDRPVCVKDPKAVSRPTFISGLKAQIVNEGRDAVFEIEVDCSSNYDVIWSKGPRDLVESHRIEMTKEGHIHYLTIRNCGLEDADEYSIKVSNRGGSKVSRAPLSVKSKPQIHLPSRWQEPTEWERGDSIVIKVPYTGYPKPKAKWTLNGKDIREGKNVNTVLKDRHAIITFENVGEEFSGKLNITLENEMGSDSANIELRINDRPPPPMNLKVEGVADGSALLSWSMPAGTGYISQYIIERCEMPGDTWIRAGTNRFSTYNCEGLVNGKEYRFRVIAENLHGRSDPCQPTESHLIAADTRQRGVRRERGEGRSDYTGPSIENYDKFYRNIWDKKIPLPTQVHKGESVYDYYDIMEELGIGTFGAVHRCQEKTTGNSYACKFVNADTPQDKHVVLNEIEVMKELHHPKLLNLHEAFDDKNDVAMVMELLTGGELFDRLADENSTTSEADAINYIRQVCEGIQHMHDSNIIHLDLKPEDLMFETSKSKNLKIVDFSLSRKLDPKSPVKVSLSHPEFAAPEITRSEPVGFYTDMWAIGVLTYMILSGLSPFAGNTPAETIEKIARGQFSFDHDAFNGISANGKDFISKLLQKQPNQRMTIYEALRHPWLNEAITDEQRRRIPPSRYKECQRQMHERMGDTYERSPAIGHLANYSSIRQNRRDKYRIQETNFDRKEAGPRFVKWPSNQLVMEGENAQFNCRVMALSEPIVTWHFGDVQLSQSVKHMQRYAGHDYSLKINRVRMDDAGHYTVRAENAFGKREFPVLLSVQPLQEIKIEPLPPASRKKIEPAPVEMFHEEETAPRFAFHLRNRYIQEGGSVKLTCSVDGYPTPVITWFKNGKELRKGDGNYEIQQMLGITSLEIYSCSESDSGRYSCRAVNSRGEHETECKVIVEASRVKRFLNAQHADRKIRSSSQQPTGFESRNENSSWRDDRRTLTRLTERHASEVREINETRDKWSNNEIRGLRDLVEHRTSNGEVQPIRVVAPKLSKGLKPITQAELGKSFKLEARFEPTNPPTKIQWYFNNQEITSNSNIKITTSEDGEFSYLEVFDSSFANAGDYEAKAGTTITRTSVKIEAPANSLNGMINEIDDELSDESSGQAVEQVINNDDGGIIPKAAGLAPLFTVHPISQTVKEGDTVCLECTVSGDPIPEAEWYYNDGPIQAGHIFSQDNEIIKLELQALLPEDTGTYECRATSSMGKASTVAFLVVEAADEEPKGPTFLTFPQSRSAEENESVTLKCSFGNSPVEEVFWFRNDTPLDSNYCDFDKSTQTSICILPSVKASNDSGIYSVKIIDVNGNSFVCKFYLQVLPSLLMNDNNSIKVI
uniref:non-specific serine/threonine protein kinase n=1 Tax=Schistosoma mansoni TaxID=6183 RepID=A0A3Q0KKY1_SCHMA